MNIAFVSSEVAPFSKTGGVADVAGALPLELARRGHKVSVFTPYYRCVRRADAKAQAVAKGTAPVGGEQIPWTLYASSLAPAATGAPPAPRGGKAAAPRAAPAEARLQFYFIGNDGYFDREGLYGSPQGDYEDNCSRFVFFCQACLAAAQARGERVDLWHCHDWQAGLVPVYLKTTLAGNPFFSGAASVFTIHNLPHRGLFWHWDWPLLNLPWQHYNWRELEFHGKLSLLKGALVFSDLLVTVSPSYAREIQTPEFGYGLEGVLAERKDVLFGIVNGADALVWNPRTDALLPATYSASNMAGKRACKEALRRRLNLPQDASAVVGVTARLFEQQDGELLAQSAEELLRRNLQVVLLGTGGEDLQALLQRLQAADSQKLAAACADDDGLAHLVVAGSDLCLLPSRHEPCGLEPLHALAYGTLPVGHAVGGLADTVTDATPEALADGSATGFHFREYTPQALLAALDRALQVCYEQPQAWRRIQVAGMSQDWSWRRSALKYLEAYECALKLKVLRRR